MSKPRLRLPPQTTGHIWDGNIQEFNNPIPRWWLWGFYVAIALALLYWLTSPAWSLDDPTGPGLLGVAAKERVLPEPGFASSLRVRPGIRPRALRRKPTLSALVLGDQRAVAEVPGLMAGTRAAVRQLYADNCAACHGAAGAGVLGAYPGLADRDWLWGGEARDIEASIADGRRGFMPGFDSVLDALELEALATYVLSLSSAAGGLGDIALKEEAEQRRRGKALYEDVRSGCSLCHGKSGRGNPRLGASNLTDSVWVRVDVPGARTREKKKAAIVRLLRSGVADSVMPSWKERLSAAEIKLMAIYVHELGRGRRNFDASLLHEHASRTPARSVQRRRVATGSRQPGRAESL
jgi:cytochrome c oxidase cbb3-type subunit 3